MLVRRLPAEALRMARRVSVWNGLLPISKAGRQLQIARRGIQRGCITLSLVACSTVVAAQSAKARVAAANLTGAMRRALRRRRRLFSGQGRHRRRAQLPRRLSALLQGRHGARVVRRRTAGALRPGAVRRAAPALAVSSSGAQVVTVPITSLFARRRHIFRSWSISDASTC